MTDLNSKAQQATTEVLLAGDSEGVYRLSSTDLTPAVDIADPEGFPHHGDFLTVQPVVDARYLDDDPEQAWADSGQETYLECPANLAATLVELSVSVGQAFAVENASKDGDGLWRFTVEPAPNPDHYDQ